ncbi:MAG: simple sugar transport system permease protein [Ilumatobacter sp.]|jgi:simple sugar transport system permease protein
MLSGVLGRVTVKPRAQASVWTRAGVPLLALVVALMLGAVILVATGANPIEVYREMINASLNGKQPIERTLTFATPLLLTGLAAAVAFRMKLYSIGAEGQLFMGAIAASGIGLQLPADTPKVLMLTAMFVGGALAGAVWAGFAAVPKALFGTDEIITTLMLNFVALGFMNYLIFGSQSFWRDPSRPVPQGNSLPESARLPLISGRLHSGFVIAVVIAVLLWWILKRTTFGFRIRTIGDSVRAARYAGVGVPVAIVAVLAISGGLAGVAGAIEVSGVTGRLDPSALAIELGYTGIVIATVARLNPIGVIPVAILLAAIATSGGSLQSIGVQVEVIRLLQGLIFLSVTAGEFFVSNRLGLRAEAARSASEPDDEHGAQPGVDARQLVADGGVS